MHKSLNAKAIDSCVKHAVELFEKLSTPVDESQIDVLTWPQTWPNTACGSTQSGIYLQTFFAAPTVVVISPHGPVCVFHNGIVAGFLQRCTKGMKDAIAAVNIPGADNLAWWREQRVEVEQLVSIENELLTMLTDRIKGVANAEDTEEELRPGGNAACDRVRQGQDGACSEVD